MNIVTMSGRLTKDPELRRTGEGIACCSFSLAVRRPKSKDTTDFHDCVAWRQSAEYLCQYGHKGDIVCVSGPLTKREWTDKDGNKRYAVEVLCDSVELITSKKESNTAQSQNIPTAQPSYQQQGFEPINDPNVQLPF